MALIYPSFSAIECYLPRAFLAFLRVPVDFRCAEAGEVFRFNIFFPDVFADFAGFVGGEAGRAFFFFTVGFTFFVLAEGCFFACF